MGMFIPSDNLEAEDISCALAVNYFLAIHHLLIEYIVYNKDGEEVAEVLSYDFDGSNFQMQVYWYDTSRPSVDDVVFSDLGLTK